MYYTKTGRTGSAVSYLARELRERGIDARVFLVKPARDYYPKLLHLNPRLVYETLTGKTVEITGLEDFDPQTCRALVVATPIWIGRLPPPIATFVKRYAGKMRCPVYVVTTSMVEGGYAAKVGEMLKRAGYDVRKAVSLAGKRIIYDRLRVLLEDSALCSSAEAQG